MNECYVFKSRVLAAVRLCVLFSAFSFVGIAQAQEVISFVSELDFDDPQAWAMKFYTSASLLTSMGPVEEPKAGDIEVGFEAIQIPHLDLEQRTVGFGGIKEEELNRAPVWGRLRVAFGLPRGFRLVAGWAPPVEIDGVEASLISAALERRLWRGDSVSLHGRVFAQVGDATGDFTCAEGGSETYPVNSPENRFGCREPSSDTIKMGYVGIELVATKQLGQGPTLHLGLGLNELDMEFQVDALTFDIRDRNRLQADGSTVSVTFGATWSLQDDDSRLGLELFYSPLDVDRPGPGGTENDPLFNLRALFSHRF